MPRIKQLEGKPFIIKLDGAQRTIGAINRASIQPDRRFMHLSVELTDEEVAGIIGLAADKAEASESPIGLSDKEITDILAAEAA